MSRLRVPSNPTPHGAGEAACLGYGSRSVGRRERRTVPLYACAVRSRYMTAPYGSAGAVRHGPQRRRSRSDPWWLSRWLRRATAISPRYAHRTALDTNGRLLSTLTAGCTRHERRVEKSFRPGPRLESFSALVRVTPRSRGTADLGHNRLSKA